MAKSFVLQALKIFGLEEILKLSQATQTKSVQMKKAAGAELIVWSDAPPEEPPRAEAPAKDNVLPFKKKEAPPEPIQDPSLASAQGSEETGTLFSSDFLLWQRELTKDSTTPLIKDAVKGYSRSTEMYIVKTPTIEGKEKIRFASTNGVLVNKKQA